MAAQVKFPNMSQRPQSILGRSFGERPVVGYVGKVRGDCDFSNCRFFCWAKCQLLLESTETSDLGVICMAFVFLPIAQVYYFSSLIWLSLDVNDIINVLF